METSEELDPARRRPGPPARPLGRPTPSRAANLALLLISAAIALVILELLVRGLYGAPPGWRVPQVKHQLTSYGYKLVPEQSAYSGGAPVYSNRHGFRGPDWSTPKPPGVFRVMVLGDSVSFGNMVAYEDTFAARLQRRLSERGQPAEVILTAVGGWDTALEHAFLEAEGLRHQPDVVVLGFFYNDYTRPHRPSTVTLTSEGRVDERPGGLRWVPYGAVYAVKRSALVAFARTRVANYLSGRGRQGPDFYNALMANQVPLQTEERITSAHRALTRINALCARHGVRLLVVHLPPINLFWHPRGTREYLQHLQRFCSEQGIPFLDLSERFWGEKDANALYMHPWDYHFSPRGHDVAAEALAARLREWLGEFQASALTSFLEPGASRDQ